MGNSEPTDNSIRASSMPRATGPMDICFYAPFKPLDHPDPSGDRVIGTGIRDFLERKGHRIRTASALRMRWIYWKPWMWPALVRERRRIFRRLVRRPADLWLTYHSYYKAPDVLGPAVSGRLRIPYVIFQGIFSTKRRRDIRTRPGFLLNRSALNAAAHVLTNKRVDLENLRRILPDDRLTYLAPGIFPDDFRFDPAARTRLRRRWQVADAPVVLAAAMFRPDVKTEGLEWLLRACGRLHRQGAAFWLVIAGEGRERARLGQMADVHLPGRVRFTGKIRRKEMHRFYSAGDVFAFPGIRESLGMVYLEAQSCGLPVVAFDNGGIPEVVRDGETGFLTPLYAAGPFARAIARLLHSRELRRTMGAAAARSVRAHHDLNENYREMERMLRRIVERAKKKI